MAVPDAPEGVDDARAVRALVLERLHYTLTIVDFYEFRQDYRYVYSGAMGVSVLPLIWRDQSAQTNMVTEDWAHRNLIYLPSGSVTDLTRSLLESYGTDIRPSLPPADLARMPEVILGLKQGVGLGRSANDNESARNAIKTLSEMKTSGEEGANLKRRLIAFSKFLTTSYLPFVQLRSPSPTSLVFVHHGVDYYLPELLSKQMGNSWWERVWFAISGRIDFEVPLPLLAIQSAPWATTNSFHSRVRLPGGLHSRGSPIGLPVDSFRGTGITESKNTRSSSQATYSYLSKASMERLATQHNQTVSSAIRQAILQPRVFGVRRLRRRLEKLLQESREEPKIRVGAKVAPVFRLTAVLLWVVVAIDLVWSLSAGFEFSTYAILLSALILVLLSGAVYVMDKPMPRYMMAWQAALSTASFLAIPAIKWALSTLCVAGGHH